MVTLGSIAAVLLYLIPIAVILAGRARRLRERAAWEVALDIPTAVSVDLLGILLLTRFLRLDMAAIVGRALWIGGGAAYLITRRTWKRLQAAPDIHSFARETTAGPRELCVAAVSALSAVFLSFTLSRSYAIWDRLWHVPLVASLRAQRIPFTNVFQPDGTLHYHFTGDVLAALLQTFSGGIIHASLALSLAHDVLFGLVGMCLALLLVHFGLRSVVWATTAVVGVLLSGPFTLAPGGAQQAASSYSLLNLLTLSFRPHVSLAELLLVGFIGVIAVRVGARGHSVSVWKTAPILIASTALLGITDEASIGVAGLALGATWLVDPEVLAPKRKVGAIILLLLLVVLAAVHLLFSGSLAPGAPPQDVRIVPLRVPGFMRPSILLSSARGWWTLAYDMFPVLGACVVGFMLSSFSRDRLVRMTFLFFTVLAAVSALLLTGVEVAHSGTENHRFATAALFLAPVLIVVWLLRVPKTLDFSRGKGALAALTALLTLGLPVISTLEWLWTVCPQQCQRQSVFFTPFDLYTTNCRADTAAEIGEPLVLTFVGEPVWYVYAGCHPIFSPGLSSPDWSVKVTRPLVRRDGLAALHEGMIPVDQPLKTVCPKGRLQTDPVCAAVITQRSCDPLGALLVRCAMDGPLRERVIAGIPEDDRYKNWR